MEIIDLTVEWLKERIQKMHEDEYRKLAMQAEQQQTMQENWWKRGVSEILSEAVEQTPDSLGLDPKILISSNKPLHMVVANNSNEISFDFEIYKRADKEYSSARLLEVKKNINQNLHDKTYKAIEDHMALRAEIIDVLRDANLQNTNPDCVDYGNRMKLDRVYKDCWDIRSSQNIRRLCEMHVEHLVDCPHSIKGQIIIRSCQIDMSFPPKLDY